MKVVLRCDVVMGAESPVTARQKVVCARCAALRAQKQWWRTDTVPAIRTGDGRGQTAVRCQRYNTTQHNTKGTVPARTARCTRHVGLSLLHISFWRVINSATSREGPFELYSSTFEHRYTKKKKHRVSERDKRRESPSSQKEGS